MNTHSLTHTHINEKPDLLNEQILNIGSHILLRLMLVNIHPMSIQFEPKTHLKLTWHMPDNHFTAWWFFEKKTNLHGDFIVCRWAENISLGAWAAADCVKCTSVLAGVSVLKQSPLYWFSFTSPRASLMLSKDERVENPFDGFAPSNPPPPPSPSPFLFWEKWGFGGFSPDAFVPSLVICLDSVRRKVTGAWWAQLDSGSEETRGAPDWTNFRLDLPWQIWAAWISIYGRF